ncbi:hypothetical protein Pint_20037 [Pistacia integerrima]|uniref:Uncharacterized protein n=1 Tax=Pistacia integerrima TaxID=434235 RepID=A0ACC0X9Z1_9ROSI|nr:hypothetical protein Pint_20037 [Pistacia integerrima]
MSGTIDKVKETLHMGGQKKEGEQKGVYHGEAHKVEQHHGVCKPEHGEHKVGVVQKIKDRVQGQGDQHGHGVEQHRGENRPEYGEHKEGMVEQIKDKVHGQGDQHGHGVEKK